MIGERTEEMKLKCRDSMDERKVVETDKSGTKWMLFVLLYSDRNERKSWSIRGLWHLGG